MEMVHLVLITCPPAESALLAPLTDSSGSPSSLWEEGAGLPVATGVTSGGPEAGGVAAGATESAAGWREPRG